MDEALNIYDAITSIDKTFTKIGVAAKWEARGEERKAVDIAQNMVNLGLPLETVISATMLEPEKVKALYKNKGEFIPSGK